MEYTLKIITIENVTHDVRCIRLEKPNGYTFIPGQATEVAINKEKWKTEKRPFTFTGLNEDPYLEFTIKCYSDHDGVTHQIKQLIVGDELIIDDPWGAIAYNGEGYFIAGGAGITPFIAIFRQLQKEGKLNGNKLFFSNKTQQDIIYEQELKNSLGTNVAFVLSNENAAGYYNGYINEAFLQKNVTDFKKQFYICGPDAMTAAITDILVQNGADINAVTFEK